jgi:hypothetical protein
MKNCLLLPVDEKLFSKSDERQIVVDDGLDVGPHRIVTLLKTIFHHRDLNLKNERFDKRIGDY